MGKSKAAALNLSSVITRNDAIVYTDLDDTIVMMDVDEGQYYELDPIAARVWGIIENSQTVEAVCKTLAEEFDVDPSTCQQETLEFLQAANEQSIVKVQPNDGAAE